MGLNLIKWLLLLIERTETRDSEGVNMCAGIQVPIVFITIDTDIPKPFIRGSNISCVSDVYCLFAFHHSVSSLSYLSS